MAVRAWTQEEEATGYSIRILRSHTGRDAFLASINTTGLLPCAGYTIRSRALWSGDTVTVFLLGFLRPAPCVGLPGEATGEVGIGSLSRSRTILRIISAERQDLYSITRLKGRMVVTPLRYTFTSVSPPP
jgi:hypothetical protein